MLPDTVQGPSRQLHNPIGKAMKVLQPNPYNRGTKVRTKAGTGWRPRRPRLKSPLSHEVNLSDLGAGLMGGDTEGRNRVHSLEEGRYEKREASAKKRASNTEKNRLVGEKLWSKQADRMWKSFCYLDGVWATEGLPGGESSKVRAAEKDLFHIPRCNAIPPLFDPANRIVFNGAHLLPGAGL